MHRSLPIAIAFGLAFSFAQARTAAASPSYPAVIKQEWALRATPDCTLCHATDSGGRGTVITYFGLEMESLGLTAANDAALIEALGIDKAQEIDSDGSGTSDYDDLVAGRDPSSGPGPKGGGPIRPLHGCAVAPPAHTNRAEFGALGALLLLAFFRFSASRARTVGCDRGRGKYRW